MAGGQGEWRLRSPFGDVEIELHPSTIAPAAQEDSLRELSRLVSDFKYRHPEARRVLLAVMARLGGLTASAVRGEAFELDTGSSRADAIGAELLSHARAGNLVVRRRVTRSVVIPLDVAPEPELGPLPVVDPTAWIAIELVDDEGNPVPNVDYLIKCDDGRVLTGTTNAKGKAREEGLHDGNCKVSFPGLNAPDWKKVG
jgi:hypothetical protein